MPHPWRLLLVPLVCATVSLALAPAAAADRVTRADALGDVAAFVADSDEPINKPGTLDPDVVRTRLAHRAHAVVIRLRFRDLVPHKRRTLLSVVRTPGHGADYSIAIAWRRNGSAVVQIEHAPDVVDCPGLRQLLDVERNIIRVRIPRTCLGSPGWVRVGMHVQRFVPASFTMLTDDPLSDVTVNLPRFSARLHRG